MAATFTFAGAAYGFFLSGLRVDGPAAACRHVSDGALWIVDGHIVEHVHGRRCLTACRPPSLASSTRYDYGQRFILPGLVDTPATTRRPPH